MSTNAEITISQKEIDMFNKAFNKAIEKGKSKTDAILRAEGNALRNYLRNSYPKVTGNLRKGVKMNQPKTFESGSHVVRILSTAPHSHLVEFPHKMFLKEAKSVYLKKTDTFRALKDEYLGMSKGNDYVKKAVERTTKGFEKKVEEILKTLEE